MLAGVRSFLIQSVCLTGALTVLALPASATPVIGTLGFTGVGMFISTIAGPISYFDFDLAGAGAGVIGRGGVTGSFAVIPPLSAGTILDLSSAPLAGFATAPPGVPVSVNNFIAFPALVGTNLRLTLLPIATCIATATQQCVGALQFNQNGLEVAATLNIVGQAINGPHTTSWSGSITAQYNSTTIGAVIAALSSPVGVRSESWSGQITATGLPQDPTIPEPSTLAVVGGALLALAFYARRKL